MLLPEQAAVALVEVGLLLVGILSLRLIAARKVASDIPPCFQRRVEAWNRATPLGIAMALAMCLVGLLSVWAS